MKKLLIFTLILSGFSFVNMEGNCSEDYDDDYSDNSNSIDNYSAYNDESSYLKKKHPRSHSKYSETYNKTYNYNNNKTKKLEDNKNIKNNNPNSNNEDENSEGVENPIFKIAKELGINMQDNNTSAINNNAENNNIWVGIDNGSDENISTNTETNNNYKKKKTGI